MRMIGLAVTLTLPLVLALLDAESQEARKLPRVGILAVGAEGPSPREALRQGLREQGYVEGQNIALEDRSNLDHYDRLADAAFQLVHHKVDALVTFGATATIAARKATDQIPIVMVGGFDPVELGLAMSLARPGGNVTGVSILIHELFGKRLELLKEAWPGVRRVATLFNMDGPNEVASLRKADAASQLIGVKLHHVGVHWPEDFEKAFTTMSQQQVDALITVASSMLGAHRRRIVELAERRRLPAMYPGKAFVEVGGLMSYGPDPNDYYRKTAVYVDKILKGVKPADLPIEQPTKFELVINLKTATALGLTIPPSVLGRADHIIE